VQRLREEAQVVNALHLAGMHRFNEGEAS
jgi:hypothetical protein